MSAIQRRRLGRTGIEVAELGLGAMDTPTSDEGEETLSLALDLGVDFIDSAREYEGSEFLLGQVIRARGGKDFTVGTKTFSRTRDGAQRDVDKSLSMLGVDRIDLYQLHDISTPGAWDEVMGEGGGAGRTPDSKISRPDRPHRRFVSQPGDAGAGNQL